MTDTSSPQATGSRVLRAVLDMSAPFTLRVQARAHLDWALHFMVVKSSSRTLHILMEFTAVWGERNHSV